MFNWQRVYTSSFFMRIFLKKFYVNLAEALQIKKSKFEKNIDDDIHVLQYLMKRINNAERLFMKLKKVSGLKIFTILTMIYIKIVNDEEFSNETKKIEKPGFIRSFFTAFKSIQEYKKVIIDIDLIKTRDLILNILK